MSAMISVIIPTLNAQKRLPQCLSALFNATLEGLIAEVIIVDGGSDDDTFTIAEAFGAKIITSERGRGAQLAAGAAAARSPWFLFLHADTILTDRWPQVAKEMIDAVERSAGVFELQFDPPTNASRFVAWGAMARTKWFRLPYGDQGLLISRSSYDEIGGFHPMPLFEDVHFMDRLVKIKGRNGFQILNADAITCAERYEKKGHLKRVIKNFICLLMYRIGIAPEKILKWYEMP